MYLKEINIFFLLSSYNKYVNALRENIHRRLILNHRPEYIL